MKSCEVRQLLNISHDAIGNALRRRKIQPPRKDGSGDFCWTCRDVAALRRALARDRRKSPRQPRRKGVRV
jgi:hypothetical protein